MLHLHKRVRAAVKWWLPQCWEMPDANEMLKMRC